MPPATRSFPTSQLHVLKTHNGPVNAISFSSSPGTYLLTGSSDRAIHLTRALPSSTSSSSSSSTTASPTDPPTTTSPIQKYEAHGYSVLDIAVTADNARFASVGGDKQVFLWDVETGTTVRRWSGHDGRVEAVEFGGEGDGVVVSGSSDTTIKIWDTRSLTSKPIQTLSDAKDTISSLAIHTPTSCIISASYDGRIRTYDIRMGQVREDVLGRAPVTSVRCSADGNVVLASCLDGWIRVVDREDGRVLKAFGIPEGEQEGDEDDGVRYRNSALRIRSAFAGGDGVVFSGGEADEEKTENNGGYVFAWDVLTGDRIACVDAGRGVKVVSCVAWNKRGGYWAGGCSDGTVKVFG
ncbi:hypothetical protein AJ80_06718 [Polytolypa hystricis UAMH7299]|uniref:Uncharacterized protein n=1 Tax=Polytolypa hystricis (strain UAMH7299) TaxID=1447883 RepID=A0A2B7XUH1_POLH7|nr:hypothetical protein AJ80_06718 [Polytolypa hystricis UAMH7299]